MVEEMVPLVAVPPKVNGVAYYSWGGKTPITNKLDPFDSIVIPITKLFMGRRCGMGWSSAAVRYGVGHFLRSDYPANHYDAINHALALTALA